MTEDRMALSPAVAALLTLDTHPWLSCDECFERVDGVVEDFVYGAVAIPADFRAHLSGCPACHEEARMLVSLLAEDDRLDPAQAVTEFCNALQGPAGHHT